MTFDQLIKLLDAGFSKEEIMALNNAPQPEHVPTPQPEPVHTPQPEPVHTPQPEPDLAPAPMNDQAAILAKLEELNQTIIRSNINNSMQPERESVDDILATIIRPAFKNKEEK